MQEWIPSANDYFFNYGNCKPNPKKAQRDTGLEQIPELHHIHPPLHMNYCSALLDIFNSFVI